MSCQLCETRKPRRMCPGVQGEICSQCCGEEREQRVDCPLDCEYLQEARAHERLPELDPAKIPNQEIRVPDEFLQSNEHLLLFLSGSLLQAAFEAGNTIDNDIQECLEALVRTYKTLQSGLYYDSRPNNPIAAGLYGRLQEGVQRFRQDMQQQSGMATIRDTDVLGILVFLQRLELQYNNGRRRGRAFIDFLRHYFAEFQAARSQGELPSPPGGGSIIAP